MSLVVDMEMFQTSLSRTTMIQTMNYRTVGEHIQLKGGATTTITSTQDHNLNNASSIPL